MNLSSTPQGGSDVSPLIESAPQAKLPAPQKAFTPEPLSRRSEGAAAKRIALFFAFLLLSLFGFHHLIQFGMRRIETGEFGVTNRIVSGKVNAEIVISGSSRALTHYDPRVIQEITGRSTFNIGRNGSQTDMQLAVLKTYLQHNAPPKLIIHNLDSFSFVTTKEIYDPAQYLPYLNEEPIYQAVAKISVHAWKWKRFPLYGSAVEDMRFTWTLGLRRLLRNQPAESQFSGFQPRYTAWTGEFEQFRRSNPNGVLFPIETEGVRDMEEIALLCRAHGIPLILVYSPVYSEMQELESNRSEIFRRFREISERYGVRLWDFSTSAISKDRENFYNSQHLNMIGAAAFSRAVAARMTTEINF